MGFLGDIAQALPPRRSGWATRIWPVRRSTRVRLAKNRRRLTLEQLECRRFLSVSGNVLTDNIYPAGDTDDHFFSITEQDLSSAGGEYVVTLALAGASDSFQPRATLYSPSGNPLGSEVDSGSSRTYLLTAFGSYTVRVQDNDNRDTGTYALALEGINPPSQDAQATKLGELKSGRLDKMGQVDEYTFQATAGSIVTLALSETHSGSCATLYSPTGDKVDLRSPLTNHRVTQVTAGKKAVSDPLQAGTYVVQIHDNNYTDTGDYHFSLEGLVPASEDAGTLALGDVKTGEIVVGEVDAYKFTGAGGEIVTLSLSDAQSGISTQLWAELYSPSGQKIEKLPGTSGDDEVENGKHVLYQLPAEAGTYVLQVYDNDYTHAEPYGVALEGINPRSLDSIALGFGEQKTGTIDGMGEVDEFHFALTAADLAAHDGVYQVRLSLSSEDTVDYEPRAAVYSPTGQIVGREVDPGDANVLSLTEAGTYVIQVHDDDYTHTKTDLLDRGKDPAYTVRLQDAQPPRVQSVTVSDPLLSDADAGPANFAVTVVFNETMDTAILPTLVYGHPAVAGGLTPTLSNPAFAWSTTATAHDTLSVTYDVADHELGAAGITIGVTGAKDAAGNLQQNYAAESEFGVDTLNPFVNAFTPRDNALRVALDTNLLVAFDDAVQKGSGSVAIKRSSDGSTVETISVAGSQVTVLGAVATIDPAEPFLESTGYYVEIATGAFLDAAGNAFAGVHGGATWNFTTGDFTPPAVVTLSPADDATEVAFDTPLEIAFHEPVRAGLGNVSIKRSGDGSTVESIPVPSDQVTVSGATVTIDPLATLADHTSYYVEVTGAAFADLAGNNWAGISGPTVWNWTTLDLPPAVLSLSPPDGAVAVRQDANLVIEFNQAVRKGAGDILVKRSHDGSTFLTLAVTDERVLVSQTLVTIDPAEVLERREAYYVEIAAGALEDLSGNAFAGISGDTTWDFSTEGPIANDDAVTTSEDTLVKIEVLGNDLGIGRPLDPATLAIVAGSEPAFGTATVTDGLVSYLPGANFSGTDSFRYTVRDVVGFQSNPGLVTITVTEVADYQNPDLREDVNRSGTVTPLDVLIGINYFNAHGNELPSDPVPPDQPLYYYDVNGNNVLEPLDLLIIINYLNRPSAGSSDGAEAEGPSGDSPADGLVAPPAASLNGDPAALAVVESRGTKRNAVAIWERDKLEPLEDFLLDDLLSVLAADAVGAGRIAG